MFFHPNVTTKVKYKDILSNKLLLIANYLNPQTKYLIPITYFQEELKNELDSLCVDGYGSVIEEINNYHSFQTSHLSFQEFWSMFKQTFPRFYFLSIKYSVMAASEISVERFFSICGQIQTKQRNRMKFDLFYKLAILRYNFHKSSDSEIDNFLVFFTGS